MNDMPQTPEDCLADCAHLFPDRETENSYGNLQYRIALTRIDMLIMQRVDEAANKVLEEAPAAFMRALADALRQSPPGGLCNTELREAWVDAMRQAS